MTTVIALFILAKMGRILRHEVEPVAKVDKNGKKICIETSPLTVEKDGTKVTDQIIYTARARSPHSNGVFPVLTTETRHEEETLMHTPYIVNSVRQAEPGEQVRLLDVQRRSDDRNQGRIYSKPYVQYITEE